MVLHCGLRAWIESFFVKEPEVTAAYMCITDNTWHDISQNLVLPNC